MVVVVCGHVLCVMCCGVVWYATLCGSGVCGNSQCCMYVHVVALVAEPEGEAPKSPPSICVYV